MQYVVTGQVPARIEVGPDSRRGQFNNPTLRNRCSPEGTTSHDRNEKLKSRGGLTRALIEARVERQRNPGGCGNGHDCPGFRRRLNPGYATPGYAPG
jgi:hypothetical protein